MKVGGVIERLHDDGRQLVVARGAHRQDKHPNRPGRVTVSGKPSDEVPPGTLDSIHTQAGPKPQ